MPQSSGVQRPAASERVQKLIADVREFGRWPKRTAHSEEERRLAKRIDYIKNSRDLPHAALEELQALQAEQKASNVAEQKASKVDAVMADVRELGRWPVQHSPSKDPTREAERILAQRVAGLKAEGTCDYSKYTPTSLRNNYKESMNHMKLVCEHSSDDFLPEQQ